MTRCQRGARARRGCVRGGGGPPQMERANQGRKHIARETESSGVGQRARGAGERQTARAAPADALGGRAHWRWSWRWRRGWRAVYYSGLAKTPRLRGAAAGNRRAAGGGGPVRAPRGGGDRREGLCVCASGAALARCAAQVLFAPRARPPARPLGARARGNEGGEGGSRRRAAPKGAGARTNKKRASKGTSSRMCVAGKRWVLFDVRVRGGERGAAGVT